MPTDTSLFRTRVGRRIMGMFLLSSVVPIVTLAAVSYYRVADQVKEQAESRLQDQSKGAGMAALERLGNTSSDLEELGRGLAEPGTDRAGHGPPIASSLEHAVTGILLARPGRTPRNLLGEDFAPPSLTPGQRTHLASSRPLVVVDSASPTVLLARAVAVDRPQAGVLWGRLRTPYLWGTEDDRNRLSNDTELCALEMSGRPLSCPEGVRATLGGIGGQASAGVPGASNREYVTAAWTVFLRYAYGAPSWTVVLAQPKNEIYAPLVNFERTFPLVLLLALLIVVGLSHRLVRSSMEPLRQLTQATDRIARQEFDTRVDIASGDEFEDLAGSLNSMTRQLGKQFNTLTVINAIDRSVLSERDATHILTTVLERAPEALACNRVTVALQADDSDVGTWRVVSAAAGESVEDRHESVVRPSLAELTELMDNRDGLLIGNGAGPRSYWGMPPAPDGLVLALPLVRKDAITGVMALEYQAGDGLVEAEWPEARKLTDQVSVALANAMLVKELDAFSAGALTALARTVDANSHWTAGHSERVTQVALVIGAELQLAQDQLDTIYRGGLLHDIGKIGVPPAILDKAGPLTEDEIAIVQQHPPVGARILAPIKAFEDAIPIVRHHHERWDGNGYPDRLAAEEIPLLARVLAVADVWDALTSARPYRDAWPESKAAQYILMGAGIQFDPEITRAFYRAMGESVTAAADLAPDAGSPGGVLQGDQSSHNAIKGAYPS